MRQLPTRCSGCGQLLFVDVDDEYPEDDPLGIIEKLLKAVRCEQCLAKIKPNRLSPLKLADTRK